MARELFYSEIDKKVFYVAGYTDNSDNVNVIINTLKEQKEKFLNMVPGLKEASVMTTYVEKSSRYKYMRVFYANNVKKAPKGAFILNKENDWTMDKWLKN